ncbi:MAG: hypothetical protein DMG63_14930 [Acidobacteria bacterium]|nr:MAG: hypothetical protein DMG63_14930 [Acidobacteriota bacterium]
MEAQDRDSLQRRSRVRCPGSAQGSGRKCRLGLVALIAAAQQVGKLAGFDGRKSRQLMGPIVRQTIENCLLGTPQEAFSGPLRRGDIATLRKHLDVLKEQPELLTLYKSLTSIAVQDLPVAYADALKKLIG